MSKSKSSRRWLDEHFSDPYVKQAQLDGYRSRAVYKLLELQNKYHLFKSGMTVVDLGAAPGGWSQLITKLVKPNGKIVAVDLLPIVPIPGVDFIQGDFTEESILADILARLPNNTGADWILSDIAPNMSGNECVDIPKSMYLVELVLDFAVSILNANGGCVIKVFQGEGFDNFLSMCKRYFRSTLIKKPDASRDRSRELYILTRYLRDKTR
jgi:23S rRNA (uridine2552-2'-O)-methyltransferase